MKTIHEESEGKTERSTTETALEVDISIGGHMLIKKTTTNTWKCVGEVDKIRVSSVIELTPIEQHALFNELKHLLS